MSNKQKRITLLSGLAALFLCIIYLVNRSPEIAPVVSSAAEKFRPIAVENPALKLDLLERLKKLQYQGSHRNIFSSMAPVSASAAPPLVVAPPPFTTTSGSSGPAPLVIPASFYGFWTDVQTGKRQAFFMEGENIYFVGLGELLLGRYRLIQIGNSSVELEETATGRRTTLTMEEPNPA